MYFLIEKIQYSSSNILLGIIEVNSVHVLLITIVGGTALTFIFYQLYLKLKIINSDLQFIFKDFKKFKKLLFFLLLVILLLYNFLSPVPLVLCDSSVPAAADPIVVDDLNNKSLPKTSSTSIINIEETYRINKSDSHKWGSLALMGVSTYALTKMGVPVTWAALLSFLVFLVPQATSALAPIELPRVRDTMIVDPNSLPSYSAIEEGKTTGFLLGKTGVNALIYLHRNSMISFFVLSAVKEFTSWPVGPTIIGVWFMFTIFNQWENINATGFACSAKDTEQATSETPNNVTSKASDVTDGNIDWELKKGDLCNTSSGIEDQKRAFEDAIALVTLQKAQALSERIEREDIVSKDLRNPSSGIEDQKRAFEDAIALVTLQKAQALSERIEREDTQVAAQEEREKEAFQDAIALTAMRDAQALSERIEREDTRAAAQEEQRRVAVGNGMAEIAKETMLQAILEGAERVWLEEITQVRLENAGEVDLITNILFDTQKPFVLNNPRLLSESGEEEALREHNLRMDLLPNLFGSWVWELRSTIDWSDETREHVIRMTSARLLNGRQGHYLFEMLPEADRNYYITRCDTETRRQNLYEMWVGYQLLHGDDENYRERNPYPDF